MYNPIHIHFNVILFFSKLETFSTGRERELSQFWNVDDLFPAQLDNKSRMSLPPIDCRRSTIPSITSQSTGNLESKVSSKILTVSVNEEGAVETVYK